MVRQSQELPVDSPPGRHCGGWALPRSPRELARAPHPSLQRGPAWCPGSACAWPGRCQPRPLLTQPAACSAATLSRGRELNGCMPSPSAAHALRELRDGSRLISNLTVRHGIWHTEGAQHLCVEKPRKNPFQCGPVHGLSLICR